MNAPPGTHNEVGLPNIMDRIEAQTVFAVSAVNFGAVAPPRQVPGRAVLVLGLGRAGGGSANDCAGVVKRCQRPPGMR